MCGLRGRHDASQTFLVSTSLTSQNPAEVTTSSWSTAELWGLCFLLSLLCRPGLPLGCECWPPSRAGSLSPAYFSKFIPLTSSWWGKGKPLINCFHDHGSVTTRTRRLRGSSLGLHSHPKTATQRATHLCASQATSKLKFPKVNPLGNSSSSPPRLSNQQSATASTKVRKPQTDKPDISCSFPSTVKPPPNW